MNLEKRIVITGLGVCTPLARNINTLWERLIKGETSIRDLSITHPYLLDYKIKIGSVFDNFEIDYKKVNIDKKSAKRMCENSAVSLEAASEAIKMSGILDLKDYGEITGVSIGAGFGGLKDLEQGTLKIRDKGMERVDKMLPAKTIPGSAAINIALHYGFHTGDTSSVTTACASGASNIINGYRSIIMDDAKIMVCGGTGETSPLMHAGFGNLGALSKRNDEPEKASRPFDKDRDGFVLGDGAGVLVLEELEHAKKRDAKIYAELLSYGASNDAFHLTAPRDDGLYAKKAMTQALNRARINPTDIDYINAHGTSTPHNDSIESRVIREAFDPYSDNIAVNSTKSMIGHTLNASAAIEAVVTVLSIENNLLHPTRNLDNPDIEAGCDLFYVRSQPIERKINYSMSNAFAFGGRNVFLVFGEYIGK
jgi:3-oxoacyl-[acyl-carrier-protein] synthase II